MSNRPGPKTIPSNVHKLNGNPSKLSAEKLKDPILPEVSIPKCPAHLLTAARKEWNRVSPILEKIGLITELDTAHLASYCQAYARWSMVEAKLKKLGEDGLIEETPSGYKQMSVLLQISNRESEKMYKYSREFGMSPSSRINTATSSKTQLDLPGMEKEGAGKFFRSSH